MKALLLFQNEIPLNLVLILRFKNNNLHLYLSTDGARESI